MNIQAATVCKLLAELLQVAIDGESAVRVAGGSIHSAWRIRTTNRFVFVKTSAAAQVEAFEAEAAGLSALRDANAIRVPEVYAVGSNAACSFIAMEWLELTADSARGQSLFGTQLAALHRVTAADFGWHHDNTIGRTPQPNTWSKRWIDFFRERRLGFQLELAAAAQRNGSKSSMRTDQLVARGQLLCESIDGLFDGYQPVPSLVHGDLWNGNFGVTADGQPVTFDPAVYFGDREADLAMTRLFGGFEAAFYSAYESAWPIDAGARTRTTLYSLYHVLNHFNMFGGGYGQQAESMIDRLLAELGR